MSISSLKPSSTAAAIYNRHLVNDSNRAAQHKANLAAIRNFRLLEAEAEKRREKLLEHKRQGTLYRTVIVDGGIFAGYEPDEKPLQEIENQIAALRESRRAIEEANAFPPVLSAAKIAAELASLGPNVEFEEVERPELRPAKGERLPNTLARLRASVRDAKKRRKVIAAAPLPLEHARTAAHKEIDTLARQGQIRVAELFIGGNLDMPKIKVPSKSGNPFNTFVPNGVALVAYLFADELKKRIEPTLIATAGAFPNAMAPRDKLATLAEIDAEISALQEEEAACVEAIVADGGEAFHRHDMPVLTALGIAVVAGDFDAPVPADEDFDFD